MTRKQAEKIANAIRVVAERDKSPWETTNISTQDVAAVLKKRDDDVSEIIKSDGSAVWGCMPMGWNFTLRGSTTIAVRRPAREG